MGLEAHLDPAVFPEELPLGLEEHLVAPGFRLGPQGELREDAPVWPEAEEARGGVQGEEAFPEPEVPPEGLDLPGEEGVLVSPAQVDLAPELPLGQALLDQDAPFRIKAHAVKEEGQGGPGLPTATPSLSWRWLPSGKARRALTTSAFPVRW